MVHLGNSLVHIVYLYDPQVAYSVTVNGQLYLLQLIEALHLDGIEIISANTDGIIVNGDLDIIDKHLNEWEEKFNFEMEEIMYLHYIARDVNNYFALTDISEGKDNELKTKGIFNTNFDLGRNINGNIIYDAVIAFFLDGTKLRDTIKGTTFEKPEDFYKYLFMRSSKTECFWRGQWLGKNFRWYISKNGEKIVNEVGHKVAGSDDAVPVQDLSQATMWTKADIDYKYYSDKAAELIAQLKRKDDIEKK